jgi:uncharacterized Zn-finger protein
MGLKEDLKLKGDNYQWLSSLFYFGKLTKQDLFAASFIHSVSRRIPGLGVSHESSVTASSSRQVLRLQHHHVGNRPVPLCCHGELWRSCCHSTLLGYL